MLIQPPEFGRFFDVAEEEKREKKKEKKKEKKRGKRKRKDDIVYF